MKVLNVLKGLKHLPFTVKCEQFRGCLLWKPFEHLLVSHVCHFTKMAPACFTNDFPSPNISGRSVCAGFAAFPHVCWQVFSETICCSFWCATCTDWMDFTGRSPGHKNITKKTRAKCKTTCQNYHQAKIFSLCFLYSLELTLVVWCIWTMSVHGWNI